MSNHQNRKREREREEIKGEVVSVSTYVWMEDLEEEENNFYSLKERQVVVKVLYVLQKLQTVLCIYSCHQSTGHLLHLHM